MAGRNVVREAVSVTDWGRYGAALRGRITAPWLAALRRDPLLREARVVVDVVLGRRRFLLSTVQLRSTTKSGALRPTWQQLAAEPELVNAIEPGIPDAQSRSVSVSFRGLPADLRALLSTGWPIAGQAEVSLLVDGMDWEDRIVYLRGPISGGISFGTDEELITIGIADPQVVSAVVPPWTVARERFPEISEDFGSVGEPIPVVLTKCTAYPCLRTKLATSIVETNRFLAGYGVLTVGNTWVDGVLTVPSGTIHTVDARGLPVTLIEYSWSTGDENSSVHANLTGPKAQEMSLIPAIREILSSLGGVKGERLTERLFGEAAAKLADVGASPSARTSPVIVLNAQSRALEAIAALLGDWPMVSMLWDGPGIGPVVIDSRSEPVARLTLGTYPLMQRANGALYEASPATELRTSYQIRYGYNPMRDSWAGIVDRNPDNSDVCRMALDICEVEQPEDPIDALSIGDAATAGMIADWLVEHRSRPSVSTVVEAYPEAWLLLREGDTFLFSDPAVGITEARAVIVSRRWQRGGEGTRVEIGIRCYPGRSAIIGGPDGA